MNHTKETLRRIGWHPVQNAPLYQCPECGVKIAGHRPAGQCSTTPRPKPDRLDCIHRKAAQGKVECGTCGQTNRTKFVTVYLCTFVPEGRPCVLEPGAADATACRTCPDRKVK
jgi:ribosomal protein L32